VESASTPRPPYGFHGREQELLSLEQAFFSSGHRIVVLHGCDGQGKTVLAAEAARRFVRTGLFDRAAFVSFERGGDLELAIGELSAALFRDGARPPDDPAWAIEDALRETPTLVVFDSFENLLHGGDAPLEASAIHELLEVAYRWAGAGGSRLLITTRDPALPHGDYAPSVITKPIELGGLAPQDALELAATMLEALGISPPERTGLEQLMDVLGCHPLSIQLAVPHLREYSPGRLIDGLLHGVTGVGRQKDQSLELSFSFSLKRLPQEVQSLLPALGIFQGGAMEEVLLRVTEIKESLWQEVRREWVRAKLISVEQIPGVRDHFLRFHLTLAPSLRRRLSEEQRARFENRYRDVYRSFAGFLYGVDPKAPVPARATALAELPNLTRALALALTAGDREAVGQLAIPITHFLDLSGRWRERDDVAKRVEQQSQRTEGALTRAEHLLLSGRGETLLTRGKPAEAEKIFRGLLNRLEAASYENATTLTLLGRSLMGLGYPLKAIEAYREAARAFEQLEQDERVRRHHGPLHIALGDAFHALGRYAEAKEHYEKSLESAKREPDRRSVAAALSRLGGLTLQEGETAIEPKEKVSGSKEGENSGGFGEVLPKLQQFEPVIQGILSACRGDDENRRHVEELCAQIEQTPEGSRLAPVFRRLLEGERDKDLLDGLNQIEAAIVSRLLDTLRS
jgi:tetratricopeptide (TPR) repeat protein